MVPRGRLELPQKHHKTQQCREFKGFQWLWVEILDRILGRND